MAKSRVEIKGAVERDKKHPRVYFVNKKGDLLSAPMKTKKKSKKR